MQNRFLTRTIFILAIVFLGYWIFSGEKSSDPERTVPSPSTAVHEDDTDIEIPKLKGIVFRNDKKIAFFVDPASKKISPYQIDDPVAEFVVSDIKNNKVILLRGNEEIEIELKDQKDVRSDQPFSAGTPGTGVPPFGTVNTDIPGMESQHTSKKTVQPDGYNKDPDSASSQGSLNKHPATVGSLNNE